LITNNFDIMSQSDGAADSGAMPEIVASKARKTIMLSVMTPGDVIQYALIPLLQSYAVDIILQRFNS
jgi:hypothetical protein